MGINVGSGVGIKLGTGVESTLAAASGSNLTSDGTDVGMSVGRQADQTQPEWAAASGSNSNRGSGVGIKLGTGVGINVGSGVGIKLGTGVESSWAAASGSNSEPEWESTLAAALGSNSGYWAPVSECTIKCGQRRVNRRRVGRRPEVWSTTAPRWREATWNSGGGGRKKRKKYGSKSFLSRLYRFSWCPRGLLSRDHFEDSAARQLRPVARLLPVADGGARRQHEPRRDEARVRPRSHTVEGAVAGHIGCLPVLHTRPPREDLRWRTRRRRVKGAS